MASARVVGVGLNLRSEDLGPGASVPPGVAFVEVIAENFFSAPRALAALERLRRDVPVSLHCVGMNLAGVDALDPGYLARVSALIERLEPFSVSDHLAWQHLGAVHLHDLLPFPWRRRDLARLAARIHAVQTRLRRRLGVENISQYVDFHEDDLGEAEVLGELASRTGCGLLLDLNNLEVNAMNRGRTPDEALAHYDMAHVVEIHIAGPSRGECGWIDTHAGEPSAFQREFLGQQHAAARWPICFERDRDVPPVSERWAMVEDLAQPVPSGAPAMSPADPHPVPLSDHEGDVAETSRSAATSELRACLRSFAAAVRRRDPLLAQPWLSPDAASGLAVYWNQYRLAHDEILRRHYPVTALLLGERNFSLFAWRYLQRHPSQDPDLGGFGGDFWSFLASDRDIQSSQPLLSTFAALDWFHHHPSAPPSMEVELPLGITPAYAHVRSTGRLPDRFSFGPARLVRLERELSG